MTMVGAGVAMRFVGGGLSDEDDGEEPAAALPSLTTLAAAAPLVTGTLSAVTGAGGLVPPSAVEASGVGAAVWLTA